MNRIVKNTIIISFLLFIFPIKVFSSQYLSPLLKFGINGNRISNTSGDYYDYSYPLGYSIGMSIETKIVRSIYISNSFYYKNKQSKSYFSALSPFNPLQYKYNSHYIRFSSIIGIKIHDIADLLIGYDIGRKLKVNMNVKGSEGLNEDFEPIDHPKFDNVLCIGFAKDFKFKRQNYKIELKYLYGLNKYDYRSDLGSLPNPTRNHGLQLEFGYRIKF